MIKNSGIDRIVSKKGILNLNEWMFKSNIHFKQLFFKHYSS
jgi:hypothetical protein